MQNNEIQKGCVPARGKHVCAESATLYDSLVKFGKDYDEGNFPEHSFEVELHKFLCDNLNADGQVFLKKILPFLIELKWLEEGANAQDVLVLLKKHDSWNDLDAFDNLFTDAIEKMQNLKPLSLLGFESKQESLRILENQREEVNHALDFKIPLPISVGYRGNTAFHSLVMNLARAAYQMSTLIRGVENSDV